MQHYKASHRITKSHHLRKRRVSMQLMSACHRVRMHRQLLRMISPQRRWRSPMERMKRLPIITLKEEEDKKSCWAEKRENWKFEEVERTVEEKWEANYHTLNTHNTHTHIIKYFNELEFARLLKKKKKKWMKMKSYKLCEKNFIEQKTRKKNLRFD